MNRIIIFSISSLLFSLFSCGSNSVYYDENENAIKACNGSPLTKIIVESRGRIIYFGLKQKHEGISFLMSGQNPDYEITNSYPPRIFHFDFEPSGNYVIVNNTVPDAASAKIEIWTDSAGNVMKASKTTCE